MAISKSTYLIFLATWGIKGLLAQDCKVCTNTPNTWMTNNGLGCADIPDSFKWAITSGCKHHDNWVSNEYCQQTCYDVVLAMTDMIVAQQLIVVWTALMNPTVT